MVPCQYSSVSATGLAPKQAFQITPRRNYLWGFHLENGGAAGATVYISNSSAIGTTGPTVFRIGFKAKESKDMYLSKPVLFEKGIRLFTTISAVTVHGTILYGG
jgi:hypothetical protein